MHEGVLRVRALVAAVLTRHGLLGLCFFFPSYLRAQHLVWQLQVSLVI